MDGRDGLFEACLPAFEYMPKNSYTRKNNNKKDPKHQNTGGESDEQQIKRKHYSH